MGCGASSDQLERAGLLREGTSYPEYELSGPRSDTPHLPHPVPPKLRKAEIFNIADYSEIDRHAIRTPPEFLYGTYEELVDYIIQPCYTDLEKVRALFTWMTSIDIGSLQRKMERLPDPDTPLDYLLKIHWRMGNHAHFYSFLCQAAGIPCVVLTGVNKSAAYQLGQKIDPTILGAQWNSALIDGEWRLIDIFWASTCIVGRRSKEWALFGVDDLDDEEDEEDDPELAEGETKHQVNEFFFLTDPDQLIMTHLPDDPRWQLLPRPLTLQQFEDYVYIRDRFFQLEVSMTERSHETCVVKAPEGEVDISFALSQGISDDQHFRYLLYRQKTMENVTNYPLERYVFYQKTHNTLQYMIQLPLTGKFKMDVFGQDVTNHTTFDLLCSYLIDCSKPKEGCIPLPDNPEIGWGPGIEAERAGLVATTHKEGIIITPDGLVEIHFDKKRPISIAQAMKHNQLDEWLLKRQAVLKQTDEEVIINLRLPEAGDFAFSIFAEDEGFEGELANICNYLVRNQIPDDEDSPPMYPKLHNGILGKSYLADQLRVRATSHPGCEIKAEDPNLFLSFDHDNDMELLVQLHSNEYEVQALTDAVTRTELDKETDFEIELPGPGEYGLNVYVKSRDSENSPRIYHIHSYLIDGSTIREEASRVFPKPEDDLIYQATSKDMVRIKKHGVFYNPLVAELIRKNANDPVADDEITTFKKTDTREVFDVKLLDIGDYRMNLYEKMPNGALVDVSSYRILRHEHIPGETISEIDSDEEDEPEPELPMLHEDEVTDQLDPEEEERRRIARALEAKYRLLRQQLKAAIATQDQALLEQAVKEFEANDVPDTFGELEKAKKLLLFLKITEELTQAMSRRHLRRLERAIRAAEEANLGGKLGLQMKMARRILEQLRRIERLRHDILALDQKTIAEIKSYTSPPEPVYKVMRATFILLGDDAELLEDWKSVQNQIGKTGKQSVKRRVQDFDVTSMEMQIVQQSRRILGKLDTDDVRDVSVGAAAFYVWAIGNIEEAEYRFTQAGGDLKKLRKKKKYIAREKTMSREKSILMPSRN